MIARTGNPAQRSRIGRLATLGLAFMVLTSLAMVERAPSASGQGRADVPAVVQASIQVRPMTGPGGSLVTVRGTGFSVDECYGDVAFTDSAGAFTKLGSFGGSTFGTKVTIPTGSARGFGIITAVQIAPDRYGCLFSSRRISGSAPFKVTAEGAAAPSSLAPWLTGRIRATRSILTPAGQAGSARGRSGIECVTPPSSAANVTLDCPDEYAAPTDEPSIAVDPADPDHVVTASLNGVWPDQTIQIATSFDGGASWTIADLPRRPHDQNWDPWLSFDVKRHTVVLAFEVDGPTPDGCFQDQLITTSSDGGLTWGAPVMVYPSTGCIGVSQATLFEEGKLAIDNDPASPYFGRMVVTALYIACSLVRCRTPIAESFSDDGGATWTDPSLISGSNPQYCAAIPLPPHCDANSPPALATFAPDGSVYVSFFNIQHAEASEPGERSHLFFHDSQLLVVRSADGGGTWSPPVHVVDLEDGWRDFHCSAYYYFTCRLNGTAVASGLRGGYLATAPDGTLYLTFSDNRNGHHDVDHPVSNDDVFVMTSKDRGQTWTGPDLVAGALGDEFNPNIAVNPVTGELGIAFYDRSGDPRGKTMNVTLATGLPGSFDLTRITTAPSHLSADLWWQQTLPACDRCVYHIGEYFGIAFGSDGAANMVWADLRHYTTTPQGKSGYTMNVDYARFEG
jgi:hypothetical protein